ncbi:MAG: flagellin [Steroidobacteraceae bacterium]
MTGQVINTNIMSLNAQRNLSTSNSSLATALQRLSSGLRINSAKDDAAGMAISERFTTQIRGLNQAVRNANDGISLAQTAEGALQELTNNLQRIRELSVQSANATNSSSDRQALDAEVQQRVAEISRIASQTNFNGLKILDGSFGTSVFQVGANVGDTISLSFSTGVRANQIGSIATATGGAVTNNNLASGDLTIQLGSGNVTTVGASTTTAGTAPGQDADSAYAKAEAIKAANIQGLTVTAETEVTAAWVDIDGSGATANSTYALTINGTTINATVGFGNATDVLTSSDVASLVNQRTQDTGVTATVNGTNIVFSSAEGRNIDISETVTLGAGAAGTGVAAGSEIVNRGTISLSALEQITLGGNNETYAGFTNNQVIGLTTSTLADASVDTVDNANTTILRVDAALRTVNSLRSDFGAVQNRFESTIANLQTVSENLEASRSRIRDADFASETASLTRAQILQQAGIAILAQANAVPQNVLGLLR